MNTHKPESFPIRVLDIASSIEASPDGFFVGERFDKQNVLAVIRLEQLTKQPNPVAVYAVSWLGCLVDKQPDGWITDLWPMPHDFKTFYVLLKEIKSEHHTQLALREAFREAFGVYPAQYLA